MSKSPSRVTRAMVISRDGYACRYCGAILAFREPDRDGAIPGAAAITLDHILPLSQGGSNEVSNLVVACRTCNGTKASLTPAQAGMALHPPRFFDESVIASLKYRAQVEGWVDMLLTHRIGVINNPFIKTPRPPTKIPLRFQSPPLSQAVLRPGDVLTGDKPRPPSAFEISQGLTPIDPHRFAEIRARVESRRRAREQETA